jgi:hypothetical protein
MAGTGVWLVQETYAFDLSSPVVAILVTAVGLLTGQLAAVSRDRVERRHSTGDADGHTGARADTRPTIGTPVERPPVTVDREHHSVDCAGRCIRIVERVHLSDAGVVQSRHVLSSEVCR